MNSWISVLLASSTMSTSQCGIVVIGRSQTCMSSSRPRKQRMVDDAHRRAAGEVGRHDDGALGHLLAARRRRTCRIAGWLPPRRDERLTRASSWVACTLSSTLSSLPMRTASMGDVRLEQPLEHVVDGDVGRGAEQHPLPLLDELLHDLADGGGLAGAGRPFEEGEVREPSAFARSSLLVVPLRVRRSARASHPLEEDGARAAIARAVGSSHSRRSPGGAGAGPRRAGRSARFCRYRLRRSTGRYSVLPSGGYSGRGGAGSGPDRPSSP
jgi:hypothetical protein